MYFWDREGDTMNLLKIFDFPHNNVFLRPYCLIISSTAVCNLSTQRCISETGFGWRVANIRKSKNLSTQRCISETIRDYNSISTQTITFPHNDVFLRLANLRRWRTNRRTFPHNDVFLRQGSVWPNDAWSKEAFHTTMYFWDEMFLHSERWEGYYMPFHTTMYFWDRWTTENIQRTLWDLSTQQCISETIW